MKFAVSARRPDTVRRVDRERGEDKTVVGDVSALLPDKGLKLCGEGGYLHLVHDAAAGDRDRIVPC